MRSLVVAVMLVLVVSLAACLESNPQPSPAHKGGTERAQDTGSGGTRQKGEDAAGNWNNGTTDLAADAGAPAPADAALEQEDALAGAVDLADARAEIHQDALGETEDLAWDLPDHPDGVQPPADVADVLDAEQVAPEDGGGEETGPEDLANPADLDEADISPSYPLDVEAVKELRIATHEKCQDLIGTEVDTTGTVVCDLSFKNCIGGCPNSGPIYHYYGVLTGEGCLLFKLHATTQFPSGEVESLFEWEMGAQVQVSGPVSLELNPYCVNMGNEPEAACSYFVVK